MLAITRERMKNVKKLILCDRGNKGMCHVIKMVSFWHEDRLRAFIFYLNTAVSDNTSAAKALDSSLIKVYILLPKKKKNAWFDH